MPQQTADIPAYVQATLATAVAERASDVHVEPQAGECEIRFRVDGLLRPHAVLPSDVGASVVTRLMVMAQLLTYRRDVPQEGRAAIALDMSAMINIRVSIMPTTHGLRAAVRLPAELTQPCSLDTLQLSLPAETLIERFVTADSGLLMIVGPAGAGKTTTAYAILEAIRNRQPGISIVSLEDPVERDLPGITQVQVEPFGHLTYSTALRSLLRQDPQVLMLGEIRDAETASIAIQAALSGHRLVCTLHSADAAQAVARLLEMRVEPYQISSSLFGAIGQRLLRRPVSAGYRGRVPVCEAVVFDDPLRRLIADRASAAELRSAYTTHTAFQPLEQAAIELVAQGVTDEAEIARVLGGHPQP